MNRLHRNLLVVASAVALFAPAPLAWADQDASSVKPDPPAAPGSDRLTPSELEELLGPIALYPDKLLANVLAASVYPDEVAQAAAAVKSGASPSQIDSKDWEAPVKAVAKVPDAMKMLGDYPDWTTALGQAYLIQAKDVMDTVQTLRKKASDNGALQSTPQQTVTTEAQTIYVQSSDPEVVYVPSYQPSVVYVDDDDDDVVAAGVIGFGAGVATGLLLSDLDCDYHYGCVGWGHGGYHNDVDINTGDINIGNTANIGNSANWGNGNGPRPGQEGNAWRPNQNKATAATRPSQAQSWRNTAAGQGQGRFPASTTSNWSQGTGTRRATAGTRPTTAAGAGGGQQRPAAQQRPANASRVPSNRPPSAAPSNRGVSGAGAGSRQTGAGGAGNRPSGGRSASGGGGRSGGGSAYSGGSGTRSASQRGASSRGGGGGHSRGGGGGRGGGGRR